MFGVVNRARQNWEGILYTIVTIFLLERVRTGWNRIERVGGKQKSSAIAIRRRQYNLLRVYIERMNSATGFFKKLGRNAWDGSVQVVQAGAHAGVQAGARAGSSFRVRVTDRLAASSARAWGQSNGLALQTGATALMVPRAVWCKMRRSWRKGHLSERLQRTH